MAVPKWRCLGSNATTFCCSSSLSNDLCCAQKLRCPAVVLFLYSTYSGHFQDERAVRTVTQEDDSRSQKCNYPIFATNSVLTLHLHSFRFDGIMRGVLNNVIALKCLATLWPICPVSFLLPMRSVVDSVTLTFQRLYGQIQECEIQA